MAGGSSFRRYSLRNYVILHRLCFLYINKRENEIVDYIVNLVFLLSYFYSR